MEEGHGCHCKGEDELTRLKISFVEVSQTVTNNKQTRFVIGQLTTFLHKSLSHRLRNEIRIHWRHDFVLPGQLEQRRTAMRRSYLVISKCVDSVQWSRLCSLPVVRGFFAGFAWATDSVETWVSVDEKVRLLFPSHM